MKKNASTFAIVGLGNPGDEYANTRHNAGFCTIQRLAEALRVSYWKTQAGSLLAEARYNDVPLVLAMPQSYMNTSGGPTKHVLQQFGIKPDHLIVVHDELDIPAGDVRVKCGGGHAGHNGLRSIIDALGTRDYLRVRVGIGRPPAGMPVANYVLARPRASELDAFNEAVCVACQAVFSLIENGIEKTQAQVNGMHSAKE